MALLLRACLCLFAVLVFVDGSAVRVVVQEGSDAILPCSPSNKEDLTYKVFDWKKDGQKEVFFYDSGIHYNNGRSGQDEQFRGRVSFFPDQLTSGNASITIRNTKTNDSGEYSCVFPRLHPGQRYTVQLVVAVRVVVQEGSDAILPCSPSTKEDLTYKVFEWKKDGQKEVFYFDSGFHSSYSRPGQDEQFRGRVSFFPDQLTSGNASIIIRNTKTVDSGEYSCVFPSLRPAGQRYTVQLVVGASPVPIVTHDKTDDGILLRCVVRGASPKPEVVWKDGSGNILPAEEPQVSSSADKEGSYDIILEATVTETDDYRCVSIQQEIHHQIYSETHVTVDKDKVFESGSGVSISGIIVGLLLVAVLVALLVATKFGSIKLCWNRELEEMKQELLRECELEMEQKLLRERKLEDRQEPRKECELEEMKQKIWREGKMKTMNLDPWRERKLEEKRREIRKECKEEEMKQKIWREDGLLQLLDSPETPAEKQNGYSTGNSKEAV
ncbi:butyrophilin subfamily 2 member A2-like isoform X2 [Parambassis ranga]|uniref:Butyrophilin subfamily 2 member A2-like isoform X2 n=1 Tax=Parambassis ranga TaxID=210632 RepID=A0A6P7K5P5_9TELE|nr:butyrophilin subfamily 2 member A2-like isoform X2 [Parambassis ranga]